MGDITLPAALGVSPGLVVLAWVAIAIVAFVAVGRIERRLNPDGPMTQFAGAPHRLAAVGLVVAGVIVASLQTPQARVMARVAEASYQRAHAVRHVTPDEAAFRLLDEDPSLQLVDVRPAAQFAAFSLPRAVNVPVAELFGKNGRDLLSRPRDLKIFLADDEQEAATAASIASELGYENVAVLTGGLRQFRREILASADGLALMRIDGDTRQFRLTAGPQIAAMIKARGAVKPAVRKIKKVAGGCGV
jgi:rhodanese-related sulfurtransferase